MLHLRKADPGYDRLPDVQQMIPSRNEFVEWWCMHYVKGKIAFPRDHPPGRRLDSDGRDTLAGGWHTVLTSKDTIDVGKASTRTFWCTSLTLYSIPIHNKVTESKMY